MIDTMQVPVFFFFNTNFVQPKAFEPLMVEKFSGMVDLNGNFCPTVFRGGGQHVKGQKTKFYKT